MKTLDGRFREFRLDNGLYVALQETPTKTIAGRLRINFGALHENQGEEGLAHFLEHGLMTGGTKKYDPEEADKIIETFGFFNSGTVLHRTLVLVDMLAEDIGLFLDFASELVFNPRLDLTRFNEERERILREIADVKSSPRFKDNREYLHALYRDHPATYFILGEESVIASASVDDLRNLHIRGYNANNMVLILAGILPHNVDDLISKYFSDKKSGKNTKYEFPPAKPLENKVEIYKPAPDLNNVDDPEKSSALVRLGFLVPPKRSEYSAALQILSEFLNGDAGSRLYKSLSRRRGLAYGIETEYDGALNKGSIRISVSVPSTLQQEAIDVIFTEIEKLRNEPVQQEELDRILRTGRYNLGKTFETNDGHVAAIERRLDNGFTPEFTMENWKRVTPITLLEVAQRYLPKNRAEGKYVLLVRDPLLKT